MADEPMSLLFDPRDPTMRADPYPHYRRLREADPVHRTPFGYFVLSRYDDVDAILRDPRSSSDFPSDPTWARHRGGPDSPIVCSTRHWMMMLDGAPHRRIRQLIGRAFSARAVERLRPRIAAIIGRLVDELGTGEIDLIRGLALPLPIMVIGELLGIPAADRDQCRTWTDRIGHVVDPAVTDHMRIEMNDAETQFREYLLDQLQQRRTNPRDDILSLLLLEDADGQRLHDDEIVANVMLMFNAGHETTVNVVGNGMLALLRHPDQLALLRSAPQTIVDGIDELARYDAPVQVAARLITEDVALGDVVLPAGSKVMLLLGAANRDPEHYPDPDRLDLTRTGVRPLAFGGGPHYCVGAPLGRMEASMVFTEMLRRYDTIELATDAVVWRPHFNLRGLTELPLKLQ
jgi:cytochrome P450